MASILVPTDFSDTAYKALFYATRLFPGQKSTIYLVHSYAQDLASTLSKMNPAENEQNITKLRATIHQKLEAVKHKILHDSDDLEVHIELYYGDLPLVDIINDLIENLEMDFVVMGTKGATGLKEVFIGSEAVNVIKSIDEIPLFLVPLEAAFELPKNVVYATDLKKECSEHNVFFIKKIINEHKSRLQFAHIYNQSTIENPVEPQYRSLQKSFEGLDYTTHWISSEYKTHTDLTQFCAEHHVNLLILMYHKYGFLKRILKTPFVEKVSFHSEIPLLILPHNQS